MNPSYFSRRIYKLDWGEQTSKSFCAGTNDTDQDMTQPAFNWQVGQIGGVHGIKATKVWV